MSAKRLSLKSPPVIAAVVVLLAIVTVANVRTFGPKWESGGHPGARVQAYPALPADLDQLVRLAGTGKRTAEEPDPAPGQAVGAPRRDPFAESNQAPLTVAVPKRNPPARRSSPGLPVCTAVLVGDGGPVALIAGKTYGPGDRMGQYRIASVDVDRVVLSDPEGRRVVLEVTARSQGTFEVSGGVDGAVGAAGLAYAEENDKERKEP